MTENLKLELSTSKSVAVVVNETGELAPATPASSTQQGAIDENGMWTPTSCGTNSACPMNGDTVYVSTYDSWYYSWYAATAGSGTASMVNEDAPYSICPKGWRLPANYTYNEDSKTKSFSSITNAYLGFTEDTRTNTGYMVMEAFPLNFIQAGYVEGHYIRGGGYYYSSTATPSTAGAYRPYFDSTMVYPQSGYHYPYIGCNVRCVAL